MAISPLGLVATLVAVAITTAAWRVWLHPNFRSPLRHIPYARPDWQTALYRWVYAEPEPPRVAAWVQRTRHEGLVRYLGVGGAERLLLLSPEALREALVTNAYSTYRRPPLNAQRLAAIHGNGLLVAEGDAHRSQRRKLQPAFAPKNIRAQYPMFWQKACEMLEAISAGCGEQADQATTDVDLLDFTHRAALDVIGIAAWGRDLNALSKPHSDFMQRYHALTTGSRRSNRQATLIHAAALIVPIKTLASVFPCEFFRNIAEGRRAVQEMCLSIVSQKRVDQAKGLQKSDVLDQAMSTEVFTDDELVEQMRNMLGAGHTTTARSTVWTCFLLAKHREVQERLRHEVRTYLSSPTPDQDVDAALESMPYLRAVIHEGLRVISVIPLVRRETMKPTSLQGQHIPAGTSVVAMAWASNMLESTWGPDAKQFKPERWLEEKQSMPAQAYISFSAGPRSCIGEAFARAELAALLAVLVGRFDISLPRSAKDFPSVVWGVSVMPTDLQFQLRSIPGW